MTDIGLDRRRLLKLTAASGTCAVLGGLGTETAAATGSGDRLGWAFATGDPVRSSPTTVNGTVYVNSDFGFYALNATSGDKEWTFEANGFASPMVVDDTVYVATKSNRGVIYALDTNSGEKAQVYDQPFACDICGWPLYSSPTVIDGIIYFGSTGNTIYGVNASTGDAEWGFDANDGVTSSPTVVDDTVYIGSQDGNIYALDAASGASRWRFDTSGSVHSSPTVAEGMVYIGSGDSKVYALDAEVGEKKWTFPTGGFITSSPTVAEGNVYCGSNDNSVYALNAASGEKEWIFPTGGFVRSSPTVVDGTVYVGSADNKVYAVDAASGDQKWAFETGGGVISSPTVVNGILYIGSDDGNVYALKTNVAGSSDDSRVLLGTLGHHHGWTGGEAVNSPKASLELVNTPRLVQTVTNTRNTVNNEPEPDPPLVDGDYASIAFGLETQGLADLPSDAQVTVSVSATVSSVEINYGEFTLTKPQIEGLTAAEYPVLELSKVFAGPQTPPVFEVTTGLESVTITVENEEADSYVISGDTDTLNADEDFEVKKTPELSVGIVRIDAPVIGTKSDGSDEYAYGKISEGTIVYDEDMHDSAGAALVSFASDLLEYLQAEYPATDVEVKVASSPITGTDESTEDAVCQDYSDAYDAVYDEYPHMDVAVAIVPDRDYQKMDREDYYSYHNNPDSFGSEHWDNDDNEILQPQEAAGVLWRPEDKATVETAAQEVAHHFFPWGAYSGMYSNSFDDDNHVVPNEGETKGVRSTGLSISKETPDGLGTYTANDGHYSFMSYANFTKQGIVTDARTHRKLINSQFKPDPPEKYAGYAGRVLAGFTKTVDGAINALKVKDGNPLPDGEGGNVTVRVRDGSGNLLDERDSSQIRTTHQGEGEVLNVAQFVVPFEETAAEVEIETEGAKTTIDPVSRTLSETIARLRDDAFKTNPDERRSVMQEMLDEVGEQMQKRAYRGAANMLENDVLDKLQKWLLETDPQAANVPSKQDAIDLCKEMIDHVETLAKEFGNGR